MPKLAKLTSQSSQIAEGQNPLRDLESMEELDNALLVATELQEKNMDENHAVGGL